MLVALPVVAQQRAVDGARATMSAVIASGFVVAASSLGLRRLGRAASAAAASSAVSARRASPEASRTIAARASGSSVDGTVEPARIGDRAIDQHAEVVVGERLEREQQRPREQRRDHRERRVLGRRRDQDDPAVLDAGQQCVLLGLGEAVDLVEEQHRREPVEVAARRAPPP